MDMNQTPPLLPARSRCFTSNMGGWWTVDLQRDSTWLVGYWTANWCQFLCSIPRANQWLSLKHRLLINDDFPVGCLFDRVDLLKVGGKPIHSWDNSGLFVDVDMGYATWNLLLNQLMLRTPCQLMFYLENRGVRTRHLVHLSLFAKANAWKHVFSCRCFFGFWHGWLISQLMSIDFLYNRPVLWAYTTSSLMSGLTASRCHRDQSPRCFVRRKATVLCMNSCTSCRRSRTKL